MNFDRGWPGRSWRLVSKRPRRLRQISTPSDRLSPKPLQLFLYKKKKKQTDKTKKSKNLKTIRYFFLLKSVIQVICRSACLGSLVATFSLPREVICQKWTRADMLAVNALWGQNTTFNFHKQLEQTGLCISVFRNMELKLISLHVQYNLFYRRWG